MTRLQRRLRSSYSTRFTEERFSRFLLFNKGRGEITRSTWLASADPTKTGYGLTHRGADPALVQRLGQGARERDEQHANRWTASLKGTWPVDHRSGLQVEKLTATGHPAVPMGRGEYAWIGPVSSVWDLSLRA